MNVSLDSLNQSLSEMLLLIKMLEVLQKQQDAITSEHLQQIPSLAPASERVLCISCIRINYNYKHCIYWTLYFAIASCIYIHTDSHLPPRLHSQTSATCGHNEHLSADEHTKTEHSSLEGMYNIVFHYHLIL